MDSFGYKNWGNNSNSYNDDSYEESPPATGKYGSYGNKKAGGNKGNSDFDYDISSDFADSPVVDKYSQKGRQSALGASAASTNRFSGTGTARVSVQDRANQILERNKNVGKNLQEEDDNKRLQSYQDTYKDLMAGLTIPTPAVDQSVASKSFTQSQSRFDSTLDSPGGDSFELSAADLEVGALAARRAKEKAHDRRRRMSLDKAPHTLDQSSFTSLKESSMRAKRGTSPDFQTVSKSGAYQGMQFSSALSSIQKSYPNEDAQTGADYVRYGSMNRSDDEIYKMLNVTAGTRDSVKFGEKSSMRGSGPNFTGSSALGLGGKKPSFTRDTKGSRELLESTGDSYDGGDVSDVSYSDDETDRKKKKPHTNTASNNNNPYRPAESQSGLANKPSAQNTNTLGKKNYGSYYSTGTRQTELEEDEDAGGDSGDSDKAHSPAASKSSGGYSLSPSKSPGARGGSGASNKKSYKEDDDGDEYSLDDFEPDGQHSPKKVSAAAAALDAKPVLSSSNTRHPGAPPGSTGASPMVSSGSSGAIGTTGGIIPSYMATKPPSELGLPSSPSPSAAKKTLTPTNSTSSMHSATKAANSGMNSVEEIMQRWYTADSDFTQRSLQRLGTGGNFSLDDEDMKPLTPAGAKEGIAVSSFTRGDSLSSFPAAETGKNTSNNPPLGTGSGVAAASRDMTPSPLTTAAPTPVNGNNTGPSPMLAGGVASSAMNQSADSRSPSTSSAYSADSMHVVEDTPEDKPKATPATVTTTAAPVASAPVVTKAPVSAPLDNPFELSASYEPEGYEEVVRKPLPAFAPATAPVQPSASSAPVAPPKIPDPAPTAPAPAPAPVVAKTEPLGLFGKREGSYMTLDMLPTFSAASEPIETKPPAPQPNYHRNTQSATPDTKSSQSMSPASRYQDTEDDRSEASYRNQNNQTSHYSDEDREQSRGRPSKIVPPKIHVNGGNKTESRSRSAPARGETQDRQRESSSGMPPRKMSAATAAKIQQHKSLSPEQRRAQIKPRLVREVSKSTHMTHYQAHQQRELDALEAKRNKADAVSRLEQDNWRLNRKYERLVVELEEVRFSQQKSVILDESGFVIPPPKKPFLYKHSDGLKDPKLLPGASKGQGSRGTSRERDSQAASNERGGSNNARDSHSQSQKFGAGPQRGERGYDSHGEDQDENLRADNRVGASTYRRKSNENSDGNKEEWELHMESALAQLKEENRKLLEREKAVLVREEAVSIRETTVAMKEKMVSAASAHKTKEESKNDFFLHEELTILREREQDLLKQLDTLKASLFMHDQDAAAAQDCQLRLSMGLDPTFDVAGSYQPLAKGFAASMHKAGVYPQNVLKPQLKSYYSDKAKTKDQKGEGDDTVPVNRADYEKLVSDHAAQERLLDAFQKENDRLAKFAREKDTEQQLRSAVFFDQREVLNKELNRLKNATRASGAATESPLKSDQLFSAQQNYDEIPIATSKKTADTIRMELQMDATIRSLKDQLKEAESGMHERERDLQVTIEKLRKQNRELAAAAANVDLQKIQPQDSDFLQLQTENNVFREKVAYLQERIEWYGENQKLLDRAEEETQQYRQAIAALKRELVQQGFEGRAVDRIISAHRVTQMTDTGMEESPNSNSSAMDRSGWQGPASSNRTPTKGGRSAADIKKIKELEGIVRDLQDSLVKRHPNSTAALIREYKGSQEEQERQRIQAEQVQALRQELEDIKGQHEKRLRSLRQEHERIKMQYEKVLGERQQDQQKGAADAAPVQGLGGLTKGSTSSANNVKTLTQALNRIRELEEEIERVRTFYTKKVEEVQRKSEVQIRALKRGAAGGPEFESREGFSTAPPPPPSSQPPNQAAAPPLQPHQQELISQQVQQVTAMYAERLALLEKELMSTAEELGRVKAAAMAGPRDSQSQSHSTPSSHSRPSFLPQPGFSVSGMPPPPPPMPMYAMPGMPMPMPHPAFGMHPAMHMHPGMHMSPSQGPQGGQMGSGERQELQRAHEQRVTELQSQHTMHVAQLTAQWTAERESLQARLKDEEERCSTMRQELMNAVRGAAFHTGSPQSVTHTTQVEMRSPELKQFLQMEAQIDTLEVRLYRREKELMGAVEEAKTAATLERTRLEAIHAQEVREKDNQLVHFQQELVQLVGALRHWKDRASQAEGAGTNIGSEISQAFPLYV